MRVAHRLVESARRAELVTAGVGLLGMTHQECAVLLTPERVKSRVNTVAQMHCAERFWQGFLRGNS